MLIMDTPAEPATGEALHDILASFYRESLSELYRRFALHLTNLIAKRYGICDDQKENVTHRFWMKLVGIYAKRRDHRQYVPWMFELARIMARENGNLERLRKHKRPLVYRQAAVVATQMLTHLHYLDAHAFWRYYIMGESEAAIADSLGCSRQKVSRQLSNARRTLRKIYWPDLRRMPRDNSLLPVVLNTVMFIKLNTGIETMPSGISPELLIAPNTERPYAQALLEYRKHRRFVRHDPDATLPDVRNIS
jgi:DNA-directed RNA polymerase specialized sigma24 family protein